MLGNTISLCIITRLCFVLLATVWLFWAFLQFYSRTRQNERALRVSHAHRVKATFPNLGKNCGRHPIFTNGAILCVLHYSTSRINHHSCFFQFFSHFWRAQMSTTIMASSAAMQTSSAISAASASSSTTASSPMTAATLSSTATSATASAAASASSPPALGALEIESLVKQNISTRRELEAWILEQKNSLLLEKTTHEQQTRDHARQTQEAQRKRESLQHQQKTLAASTSLWAFACGLTMLRLTIWLCARVFLQASMRRRARSMRTKWRLKCCR